MNRIGISVRLVCAPSLAHTRRVLRFPGRSFPEHHAFSLRPSAAPASEFHGAHHGHAAQVSQVAQPAYLFHETRPFSQLVHLLSQPILADRSPNGKHRASIQEDHEEV